MPCSDADLLVEVDEVGHDLQHARADRPSALAMPTSSSRAGGERRRGLARAGAVVHRARRGEAERRRPHALRSRDATHRGDLVGGGGVSVWSAPRSPITCRRTAAWGTWAAKSMSWGRRSSASRYSPKLCHPTVEPFVQRGARDVLDAFHQLDEPVVVGRAHGREADAAVAHHDGGDAVPRRRRELAVPRGLAVVVGVDVDEAGRHERAVGRRPRDGRARRRGPPPRSCRP